MSFTKGAYSRGGFPKPGDGPTETASRHNRDGWTEGAQHDSLQLAGKQYRHMQEWTRPCAICKNAFSVFEKIGHADANSRFSNRTCEAHRGLLPAFEKGFIAWSEEARSVVAGASCGGSTLADPIGVAEIKKERDEAWEANIDYMKRLTAAIAELQIVKAENVTLRNKFAPYELQPAMERQAALPADVVGQQLLKQFKEKMPWNG